MFILDTFYYKRFIILFSKIIKISLANNNVKAKVHIKKYSVYNFHYCRLDTKKGLL